MAEAVTVTAAEVAAETEWMRDRFEAGCLAADLGCEVTAHPRFAGVFEARDPAPGVWLLTGRPEEIRAEVARVGEAARARAVARRAGLLEWLTVSGTQGPRTGPGRRPRWPQAAAAVTAMIADGTLKPGDRAPTALSLAAALGLSAVTCRKAVLELARKGILDPPVSRSGRPRVPGGAGPGLRSRGMSAALATARRDAGLTQEQLAQRAGLTLYTVRHAESGRRCSTAAWALLDRAAGARGKLVRMRAGLGRQETAVRVPPRAAEAADMVRAMIADGTLKPGDRAPGGAALHRETGIAKTYCLYALRALEAEGILVPRASSQGKLRIIADPGNTEPR
jgi:DNA-binding transcriptional regulator YhcF (GntR family)